MLVTRISTCAFLFSSHNANTINRNEAFDITIPITINSLIQKSSRFLHFPTVDGCNATLNS
ncbi:hypothetical protein L9F63_025937, partial [Diploptera punctata]